MGITAKNIVQHEIIGQKVNVSKATNKSLEGITGTIINETQNTITIQSDDKTREVLKNQIKLTFTIKGDKVEVDGKVLTGRPEDRIKK
ncbi:MAG: ribonuclease P protein subunit [archaeon]